MLVKNKQQEKNIENVCRYHFHDCKATFKLTSLKFNLFSKYNLMLVNYLFILLLVRP